MVLLLACNPYERNACVLNLLCLLLIYNRSLLSQDLACGHVNHVLSQRVSGNTVLKVKLLIKFITSYLSQVISSRIEEHAV